MAASRSERSLVSRYGLPLNSAALFLSRNLGATNRLQPRGDALLPNLSLLLRNLVFTVVVPGTVSGLVPYLILGDGGNPPHPVGWPGLVLIAAGLALYGWCMWLFATI